MSGQFIFGTFIALSLFTSQCFPQRRSFEVASIRIDNSGGNNGSMGLQGRRFVATNMTLKALLIFAYPTSNDFLLDEQIIRLPDWDEVERFDIQAIPEGGESVQPVAGVRDMVRSLLEERFQLKAHRETRVLPVYDLVLTNKKPTLSRDQTPPPPSQARISVVSDIGKLKSAPRGELRMIAGRSTIITGTAISIPTLLQVLQGQSNRIIVDKTGFDKLIDVHLEFSHDLTGVLSDAGENESSPSLFSALQDIGLRLKAGKAPLETLVVDSVHQPSVN